MAKLSQKRTITRAHQWIASAAFVALFVGVNGYFYFANRADAQASLPKGQTLSLNQSLSSPDGGIHLGMQSDGNLVLRNHDNAATWASNTAGKGGNRAVLQTDGNLVIYTAANKPVWASNTVGTGIYTANVQNDGNFVMYNSSRAVWSSNSNGKIGSRLGPNQAITTGLQLVSGNQKVRLVMQSDGNLVLYNHNNVALWSSRTNGKGGNRAIMQSDGNVVVYDGGRAVWASSTPHAGTSRLILQDDGNLVAYNSANKATWNTRTNGQADRTPAPVPTPPKPTGGGSTGGGSITNDGCGSNATHYNNGVHVGQSVTSGNCSCSGGKTVTYGPAYSDATANPKCSNTTGSGGGSTPVVCYGSDHLVNGRCISFVSSFSCYYTSNGPHGSNGLSAGTCYNMSDRYIHFEGYGGPTCTLNGNILYGRKICLQG